MDTEMMGFWKVYPIKYGQIGYIHVKFHEGVTKTWLPKMKKPIWNTTLSPVQDGAFVMDVAWLQRDSFHTLEMSVQDTDFLWKSHQIFKFRRCFLGGGFIFFIFTPTWGNDPIRLIFFKWVESTN